MKDDKFTDAIVNHKEGDALLRQARSKAMDDHGKVADAVWYQHKKRIMKEALNEDVQPRIHISGDKILVRGAFKENHNTAIVIQAKNGADIQSAKDNIKEILRLFQGTKTWSDFMNKHKVTGYALALNTDFKPINGKAVAGIPDEESYFLVSAQKPTVKEQAVEI